MVSVQSQSIVIPSKPTQNSSHYVNKSSFVLMLLSSTSTNHIIPKLHILINLNFHGFHIFAWTKCIFKPKIPNGMGSKCEVRVRFFVLIYLIIIWTAKETSIWILFCSWDEYDTLCFTVACRRSTHTRSHCFFWGRHEKSLLFCVLYFWRKYDINREPNLSLLLILSVPWMTTEFYKKLNTHITKWQNGSIQFWSEINKRVDLWS